MIWLALAFSALTGICGYKLGRAAAIVSLARCEETAGAHAEPHRTPNARRFSPIDPIDLLPRVREARDK